MKCECGRCWWNGGAWVASPSESNRPVLYLLMPHWGVDFVAHCPGSCGCRLSVEAGEPRVGEKYADLERDAKRFRAVAAHVDDAAAYAYLQIGEHALRSSLRVRQEGIFEGLRKAVAIIERSTGGDTDGE